MTFKRISQTLCITPPPQKKIHDFIITYILFLLHIVSEYKLKAYRVNKEQ